MKKLILIPLLFSLIACSEPNVSDPGSEDISTQALAMTKGLEDCKLYNFKSDKFGHILNIIRCPNSTVSTNQAVPEGKTTRIQTVVTIDGVDYVAVKR